MYVSVAPRMCENDEVASGFQVDQFGGLAWSALVDATEPPPMQAVPVPTVDELFAALANLEEAQGINTWSSRRRPGN